MLTSEDRDLLGIAPERTKARNSSAVSQVLRSIHDDLYRVPAKWELADGVNADSHYRMIVASDRDIRRRAYALAYRIYSSHGLAHTDRELIVDAFDAQPSTLTLLAQHENGDDAATVSLVFDSQKGLPCDAIFAEELAALRASGRRLIEVTRLAIDDNHQRSKTLLVRLFNFIYIFAKRVKGFDDFMIEVHPRHANYYRRLLGFELAGAVRPCPRVRGALAVLLRLDLGRAEQEIRRIGGAGAAANERTLYPHFYSWLEEGAVAEFLARSQKAMTAADAQSFGLAPCSEFPRTAKSGAAN